VIPAQRPHGGPQHVDSAGLELCSKKTRS
jgi:hypothetical protein